MTSTMLVLGPRLAVALALLTAAAAATATVGRLGHSRQIAVAAARAALQLAAVSLVITAIVGSLWATGAFVLLMCGRRRHLRPADHRWTVRLVGGRPDRHRQPDRRRRPTARRPGTPARHRDHPDRRHPDRRRHDRHQPRRAALQ
ncbi:hypothetical protein F8274_03010 [Micromonospora sp. AMSO31t]|nr:hypothetical protein F8274_03010 [Micromonospora sp. AMSO31t]